MAYTHRRDNGDFLQEINNHHVPKAIQELWKSKRGPSSFAIVAGGFVAAKIGFTSEFTGNLIKKYFYHLMSLQTQTSS